MMKKANSTSPSQAARLLDAAKKTAAGQAGKDFERALGKAAQARHSRKATRIG
jgi:hypothetical protein